MPKVQKDTRLRRPSPYLSAKRKSDFLMPGEYVIGDPSKIMTPAVYEAVVVNGKSIVLETAEKGMGNPFVTAERCVGVTETKTGQHETVKIRTFRNCVKPGYVFMLSHDQSLHTESGLIAIVPLGLAKLDNNVPIPNNPHVSNYMQVKFDSESQVIFDGAVYVHDVNETDKEKHVVELVSFADYDSDGEEIL
jgi:hypothetical protein